MSIQAAWDSLSTKFQSKPVTPRRENAAQIFSTLRFVAFHIGLCLFPLLGDDGAALLRAIAACKTPDELAAALTELWFWCDSSWLRPDWTEDNQVELLAKLQLVGKESSSLSAFGALAVLQESLAIFGGGLREDIGTQAWSTRDGPAGEDNQEATGHDTDRSTAASSNAGEAQPTQLPTSDTPDAATAAGQDEKEGAEGAGSVTQGGDSAALPGDAPVPGPEAAGATAQPTGEGEAAVDGDASPNPGVAQAAQAADEAPPAEQSDAAAEATATAAAAASPEEPSVDTGDRDTSAVSGEGMNNGDLRQEETQEAGTEDMQQAGERQGVVAEDKPAEAGAAEQEAASEDSSPMSANASQWAAWLAALDTLVRQPLEASKEDLRHLQVSSVKCDRMEIPADLRPENVSQLETYVMEATGIDQMGFTKKQLVAIGVTMAVVPGAWVTGFFGAAVYAAYKQASPTLNGMFQSPPDVIEGRCYQRATQWMERKNLPVGLTNGTQSELKVCVYLKSDLAQIIPFGGVAGPCVLVLPPDGEERFMRPPITDDALLIKVFYPAILDTWTGVLVKATRGDHLSFFEDAKQGVAAYRAVQREQAAQVYHPAEDEAAPPATTDAAEDGGPPPARPEEAQQADAQQADAQQADAQQADGQQADGGGGSSGLSGGLGLND